MVVVQTLPSTKVITPPLLDLKRGAEVQTPDRRHGIPDSLAGLIAPEAELRKMRQTVSIVPVKRAD